MTKTQSVDFEIIKEPWIKYQILDQSVLKIRTVLTKVIRKINGDISEFSINAKPITVLNVDSSLKGTPNTRPYSLEDVRKSIDKDDMGYDTLSHEFNEYILDDGTKIKIYTDVTKISKSKIHDKNGDPIYNVDASNRIDIKFSQQYNMPSKDDS